MKTMYIFLGFLYLLYTGFSIVIYKNATAENPVAMYPLNYNAGAMNHSVTVSTDADFLKSAYNVGLFEIEAAKLAQQRSTSVDVKAFATKMISDHSAMNNEVKSLAVKMKITLPKELNDPDLKSNLSKLKGLTGSGFDKEYADMNVNGHKECLSMFEKVSGGAGFSAEVKQLASSSISKLKEHLGAAQNVQMKVGKPM